MLWRLKLQCLQGQAEIFSDILEPHVLAVSWYEGNKEGTIWIVEGTSKDKPDMTFFQDLIQKAALDMGISAPALDLEILPETDWLEQTWRNFPPQHIGPFFVYGSHAEQPVPEGMIGLEINAATAFGSGEHETTTGCLLTLKELKDRGVEVKTPLDMGCGSGILGLATTKLWGVLVLAVDNDPESVRVAELNAQINREADLMNCLCNEGFAGEVVQKYGPFDLIVANILAGPLCDMAQALVATLKPGGYIVLSGLLKRQQQDVVAAYLEVGAKLVQDKVINEWSTLLLTKN